MDTNLTEITESCSRTAEYANQVADNVSSTIESSKSNIDVEASLIHSLDEYGNAVSKTQADIEKLVEKVKEQNEEALKQFQEYISIAPDRTGDRVDVAYYFMGEIYIRQTKFQHADIALSAAVRKRPLSDVWWTRLGYAREQAGNYAESLTAYEEALKLNPSKTDAIRGKERVQEHTR